MGSARLYFARNLPCDENKQPYHTGSVAARERIMTDDLEDHKCTVSIGGRTIINFRFAGDIDGLAGEEEELAKLMERLDQVSTAYGMEISAEKTKLMTNNTSGINTEIKVSG